MLESLTVEVGTTVEWTNRDGAPHTSSHRVDNSEPPVTGTEWDSPTLSTSASFSHTFTTPGTFQYYCEIHPSMRGTITVQ